MCLLYSLVCMRNSWRMNTGDADDQIMLKKLYRRLFLNTCVRAPSHPVCRRDRRQFELCISLRRDNRSCFPQLCVGVSRVSSLAAGHGSDPSGEEEPPGILHQERRLSARWNLPRWNPAVRCLHSQPWHRVHQTTQPHTDLLDLNLTIKIFWKIISPMFLIVAAKKNKLPKYFFHRHKRNFFSC